LVAFHEREDANLRRALRTATPRAAERIQLEVETVADELSEAKARLQRVEEVQQPLRITPKLILTTRRLPNRRVWRPDADTDGTRGVSRRSGRSPTENHEALADGAMESQE
jgi:hypothetical protein